ncbi:uncharacterized protein TRIADDRAFT_10380, partial [Trichoplax adhaerens]
IKVPPRTLPGAINEGNRGACDWGWQSLFAYGCDKNVIVIDIVSFRALQTLVGHPACVVKVKWSLENYHHSLGSPYTLRLASADQAGNVIVWNVHDGSVIARFFKPGTSAVGHLEWFPSQQASRDLLAVLHLPSTIILWNGNTGTSLWQKTFHETLKYFAFDPFNLSNVLVLAPDHFIHITDFNTTHSPGQVNPLIAFGIQTNDTVYTIEDPLPDNVNTSETTTTTKQDEPSLLDCIQMQFTSACRHHVFIVFARLILVFDLEMKLVIGQINLERNLSPFMQIYSCRQRNVLFCLHENGSISTRIRRVSSWISCNSQDSKFHFLDSVSLSPRLNIIYDSHYQTDSIRITKSCRVVGFGCSPITENDVILLLSDGRLLKWRLMITSETSTKSNLFDASIVESAIFANDKSMYNLALPKINENMTTLFDLLFHQHYASDDIEKIQQYVIDVKMIMTALYCGNSVKPTCLRMCPPLTTKNLSYYKPLLAVGNNSGYVHIFDLSNGFLTKEFSVLTVSIKGIEWIGECRLLLYGHSNTSLNSNTYRNEIVILDLRNGYINKIRNYANDSSSLESVRVSHLRQYFIVSFKDRPLEIWDLQNGSLIRDMPKNFPYPTSLVWHSSSNKKKPQSSDTSSSIDSESSITIETNTSNQQGSTVEHFVYISGEGVLYHFMINGNTIKDGSKIPGGGGVSTVNDMVWKNDLIIMGDTDGSLIVWDLKARLSRVVQSHRGSIRRLRISPGKGNLKVVLLFNDGVDIWDALRRECLHSLKISKGGLQIIDVDWAASDKVVALYEDGCLRILDATLNTATSPIPSNEILPYTSFNAYLIAPKVSFLIKQLLQHQPWNKTYGFKSPIEAIETNDNDLADVVMQQLSLLPNGLTDYVENAPFGTAQRCLITAKLFGDQSEIEFWTLALHYLRKAHVNDDVDTSAKLSDSSNCSLDASLDTCYDLLRNRKIFRKDQLERAFLHDAKRTSYAQTNKCECNLILLGQVDRAIKLLLETNPSDENYYADSLRACLTATICTSGAAQSTVKLVATNLIANGRLYEGVQLLCLIGKNVDACRYLQTYGEWDKAAWLAKATLSSNECFDMYRQWIDSLLNSTQEDQAILVALSLCDFTKVLELLYSLRLFDRAILFLEACTEF